MKNIKLFIYAFTILVSLSSCIGEDADEDTTDCYTCTELATEYCYTPGFTYYSKTTTTGISTVPEVENMALNGQSWDDLKVSFLAVCENGGITTDCYTCDVTDTSYCYTFGDFNYTVTVGDQEPQTMPIAIGEWGTTVKAALVEECETGLTGTWKLIDYVGTARSETTLDAETAPSIITTSILQGTAYDFTTVFMTNPNETYSEGDLDIHIVATTNTVETEYDVTTPTSSADDIETWVLDDTNLEISNTIFEEFTNTVLERTATTLKIKTETRTTVLSTGMSTVATDDVVLTYVRQ